MSLLRCAICQKFWHTAIIPTQIWDGTDNNCKIKYYYFIAFFSLLFHRYLSLHLLSLSLSDSISFLLSLSLSISSLSSLLKKVVQDHSPILTTISLPHFPVLAADLASPCRWSRRLILQPSPPTSTTLIANLQISLNWVMGVRFRMGYGCEIYDGFRCGFWISVVWVVSRGFGSVGLGF